VGIGVLALAGLAIAGTLAVPTSPIYARIGPKLFPWIAATGLGALGLALIVVGLRGGWSHTLEDRPRDPFNPASFGLVLAGLLANAALIDHLGFVLASTVQFVLIAACFGSRAHLRNAAVGFAVCLSAYLLFARLLGVNIGAGVIEGLVARVI
jgi:putative tricarboxylic transport membrane protein